MLHFLLTGILLLATSALPGFAQTTPLTSPAPAPRSSYQYGTLCGSGNDWNFDYGQSGKPALLDATLAHDAALLKKMNSDALALNYLSNHGWEVLALSAYSGSTFSGRIIYLLRRQAL